MQLRTHPKMKWEGFSNSATLRHKAHWRTASRCCSAPGIRTFSLAASDSVRLAACSGLALLPEKL
jgi:hypothetical protein